MIKTDRKKHSNLIGFSFQVFVSTNQNSFGGRLLSILILPEYFVKEPGKNVTAIKYLLSFSQRWIGKHDEHNGYVSLLSWKGNWYHNQNLCKQALTIIH